MVGDQPLVLSMDANVEIRASPTLRAAVASGRWVYAGAAVAPPWFSATAARNWMRSCKRSCALVKTDIS